LNISYEVRKITDIIGNSELIRNSLIIIWHPDYEITLNQNDINYINILEQIEKENNKVY